MKVTYVLTLDVETIVGCFSSIDELDSYLKKYEKVEIDAEQCKRDISNSHYSNESYEFIADNTEVWSIIGVFHYP